MGGRFASGNAGSSDGNSLIDLKTKCQVFKDQRDSALKDLKHAQDMRRTNDEEFVKMNERVNELRKQIDHL